MKINNFKYILLLVLSLMLFSCNKGDDSELRVKGEGLLNISLGYDLDAVQATKADNPVFKIDIKDFTTGVIVKTVENSSSLTESPLKLRAGKYIVVASNGTDIDAAFNSPFYQGKDTVVIVAGESAASTIECTLANVKVSILMSESITTNFSKYDVTVTNQENGYLLFDKEHLDSAGYFKCTGTLKWSVNLTNTDGQEFVVSNIISNVKPREHYKISFDVNGNSEDSQGGASISVSYDTEMTVKEYSIDISLNKKAMPVISDASGADVYSLLRAPQGAGVLGLLNINAAAGITDVVVSHSNSVLTELGVPKSFSLLSADAAALSLCGISWSTIETGVSTSASLDLRTLLSQKLALGEYSITIDVFDAQSQHLELPLKIKVIPDVEVSIISVDMWGKFGYVYFQYNTEAVPDGMAVRYKKSSESSWSTFAGTYSINGVKYSAKITGLEPNTPYDFQVVSTKDVKDDNILSGTTSGISQLPFSSFDSWIEDGGAYYPTDNLSNLYWDSANKATGSMGTNPTTQSTSFVVSGSSAKLKSESMLGVLAAGNLYTGYFVERSGTNAKVSFGRPFTDRPLRLKGYYNYAPVAIDKAKDPYTSLKGQMDYCQIYIMLTTWTEPYVVDSGAKNFINPSADYVVAYGQLSDNAATGASFKEFSIELNYLSNKTPTHIVVVGCASKYGDYFTGGVGSVLYLDEFSLEYE